MGEICHQLALEIDQDGIMLNTKITKLEEVDWDHYQKIRQHLPYGPYLKR